MEIKTNVVNEICNHTFDDRHYVPTEQNIADSTTIYQEFH